MIAVAHGTAEQTRSVLEFNERQCVIVVHRNDELLLLGVVAHGRAALGIPAAITLASWPGRISQNAAEADAADVLGSIRQDDDAVIASLYRVFRADQFAD